MSAAGALELEGELWWRESLSELTCLKPPAAALSSINEKLLRTHLLQFIRVTCWSSHNVNFTPKFEFLSNLLISSQVYFYSRLFPKYIKTCSRKTQSTRVRNCHGIMARGNLTSTPLKMHPQVTSGSLAVSTIEDTSPPRKYTTESLSLASSPLVCNPSGTPNTLSSDLSAAAASFDSHQYFDSNTSSTTTPTDPTLHSTIASEESFTSHHASTNLWNSGKSLSKCNSSNSRGSLTCKNKGLCCGRRRLLDEDGYIRRAACICVNAEETQVLLVTSKKDPCAWLVPGGGLEPGEETIVAAQREAWEEAGVQGVVKRFLGVFESYHHSGTKKHRTAVFVFVVTKEHMDFPEARLGRRRRWFSLEEALLLLARHRPLQSTYLQLLMMSKLKMAGTS